MLSLKGRARCIAKTVLKNISLTYSCCFREEILPNFMVGGDEKRETVRNDATEMYLLPWTILDGDETSGGLPKIVPARVITI